MSSKFFTWTKGERRQTAAGIVPIPAECISIRGLDYDHAARDSNRPRRRPIPSAFDQDSMIIPPLDTIRANESIALQDAALQSATSLMAVVNDMLRSPPVSAHLSAHHYANLPPGHGRPRSQTAPPTPLVEAPTVEPVELPGSLLVGKKSFLALDRPIDVSHPDSATWPQTQDSVGSSIVRPRSSPQEKTYTLPYLVRHSTDCSPPTIGLHPPHDASPRSKSNSPHRLTKKSARATSSTPKTPGVSRESTSKSDAVSPGLGSNALSPRLLFRAATLPIDSPASPRGGIAPSCAPADASNTPHVQPTVPQQVGVESFLLHQISLMRSSHEAHVSSLKFAHEREIASYQSYVALLENRAGMVQGGWPHTTRNLTLDTSHTRLNDDASGEGASVTTRQSPSSLGSHSRSSQETAAEAETLKRKLSLAQKVQAESSVVRKERDHLRKTVETSEHRIAQLKDIVRKAKDQEKILRATIDDLEARLVLANNERTDALEGLHESSNRIDQLVSREATLLRELNEVRSRTSYGNETHASDTALASAQTSPSYRPRHVRTKSDIVGLTGMSLTSAGRGSPEQNDRLRRQIAEKDTTIGQLEQRLGAAAAEQKASADRIVELEALLYDHKKMLAAAKADCESYYSQLQSELRRQSRRAAQQPPPVLPPEYEPAALQEAAEKAKFIVRSAGKNNSEYIVQSLEREIEYCLKEMVLYKLDIRGYKKDLKRAQARIEELHAITPVQPLTPDRESPSSALSSRSNERPAGNGINNDSSSTESSGLGITLSARAHIPDNAIATATAVALTAASPPPLTPSVQAASTGSPPHHPKTPLGTHKRLPKPPTSRTPSPAPAHVPSVHRIQRGETVRSLSDSIISSYANRSSPPGQEAVGTPTATMTTTARREIHTTPSPQPLVSHPLEMYN